MPSIHNHPSRPARIRISRRHIVLTATLGLASLGFASANLLPNRDGGSDIPIFLAAESPDWNLKIADEDARLNILFIGNSLTSSNDLPGMLDAMIDSTDFGPVHIESLTRGNFGLEDHWKYTVASEVIAKGGWDIVIIQQGPSATEGPPKLLEFTKMIDTEVTTIYLRKGPSTTERRPSLLEYSKIINAAVAKQEGRTALYQVWPSNSQFFEYDGVCDSYRMAAKQIDGMLFPVGEAFRLARKLNDNLSLLRDNDFLPNPNGTYLAALIMFQQVTGRPPHGLPANFETPRNDIVRIAPEIATMLQKVAAEANEKFGLD